MDVVRDIIGPPLTRAACSALVERLRGEASSPNPNDILRIAKYAFIDKPEGVSDWARAEVFEFLKARAAGLEASARDVALNIVVGGMLSDIQAASRRYDLTAPETIGEAVQLTFFGGDPGALKWLHSIIELPTAYPATYFRAFAYNLAAVSRDMAKVPRDVAFLKALTEIGIESKEIVQIHLRGVTEPDHSDDLESTYGRAAQAGAGISHYGVKADRSPAAEWRHESATSIYARKMVHVKIVEIAEACGLSLVREPPPQLEWYADLKFPFIHTREVKKGPNTPPKLPESQGPAGHP